MLNCWPILGAVVGLAGMAFLVYKYRKQLAAPQAPSSASLTIDTSNIQQVINGKKLDFNFWLPRLLSRAKLLLLKSERRLEQWLQSLKTRSKIGANGNGKLDNSFWEQLKSTKKSDNNSAASSKPDQHS